MSWETNFFFVKKREKRAKNEVLQKLNNKSVKTAEKTFTKEIWYGMIRSNFGFHRNMTSI